MAKPTQGLPSDDLPQRYRDGDRQALDELWQANIGYLRARALRQCRNDPQEADDVLADAYLHLRERARLAYDPRLPWRPWAASILGHLIINRFRRRAARREVPLNPQLAAAVEEAFDGEAFAEDLEGCLTSLPGELLWLFRQRYGAGRMQLDLALELGRSGSYVSRRLEAARAAVRDCLAGKGYGG
jgi:RNA polymerase sigma factor (sigma-70 family)